MRKLLHPLVVMMVLVSAALLPPSAYADWELYDDFESASISSELWELDDPSAVITVAEGKVRFEHLQGHPHVPSYLIFKKNPGNIKAIRAKVTVESCTGDAGAKIVGTSGKDAENRPVSVSLVVEGSRNRVYGKVVAQRSEEEKAVGDENLLHQAAFMTPEAIIGKTLGMTIMFGPASIIYTIDGLGINIFVPAVQLSPPDKPFKALGTVSPSGADACVVTFDDIHVWTY